MNTNLSDISSALTTSLATTGVSIMTGPIKISDGSAPSPSLTLATDTTTGWYKSSAGAWTFVSTGTAIITLGPSSVSIGTLSVVNLTVTGTFSVAANRIVGEVVDYAGTSAPSLWLFAFGQAISRTTFSSLFATLGTTFGAGDGSTTFNVPDYRGRIGVGKDNMGGSTAGRITVAGCGVDGTVLAAVGGLETNSLTSAQLASHTHTGTADANGDHNHSYNTSTFANNWPNIAAGVNGGPATGATTGNGGTHTHTFTTNASGSGSPHNNVQPIIIINKMIYAAV